MSAVRVRHRPPSFARAASEGCRAKASVKAVAKAAASFSSASQSDFGAGAKAPRRKKIARCYAISRLRWQAGNESGTPTRASRA
jgi:hypothetical protein